MTPLTTPAPARAQHLLERAVCLILSCGYLGNQRKIELGGVAMTLKAVDEADDQTLTTEKDELGARKKLFASKDLAACRHAVAAVKERLRAMSVDGGMRIFGPGCYLLPLLAVDEAERVLDDGKALVAAKAEELAARLPQLLEQRQAKLGPLFNAAEYPTADAVRAAYKIDWHYVSFATPEQLQEVDKAAYARAKAKNDSKLADAYQDVILGLRESAALVMQELAERLKPGEDGKPKALRPTALRDLQDLLNRLPVLNSIGEDEPLQDALARIGALSQGLDVETLRMNKTIRGMLLEAAEKTAETLDALVLSGRRAMVFGDDSF